MFAHSVCCTSPCAVQSANRTYIDNVASTLFQETVYSLARAVEGCHYVNVGEALHHLVRYLANGAKIVHNTCIVYQDIQLALFLTSQCNDVLCLVFVSEVGCVWNNFSYTIFGLLLQSF